MRTLFLMMSIPAISTLHAETHFFEKHAEGWHWYQNQEEAVNKYEEKKTERTPSQRIKHQRKELEKKLHAAIIEPSRENIITYLKVQKALMDQSQRFAESWKDVLYRTPSFDETLDNPIDQNARHIYYDQKSHEREKKIKALAKSYGLFFFFRKECTYCHGFSPIVKAFSHKYGWEVMAISLDGGSLPEFPNARQDNGISKRLHISHVPALIAINPETGQMLPIAYGMVSQNEIEERIELLMKSQKEDFRK